MSETEPIKNPEALAEEFIQLGLETDKDTIEQLIHLGVTTTGFDILKDITSNYHNSNPRRFALELSRSERAAYLDNQPDAETHVDRYALVASGKTHWYFSLSDIKPEYREYDNETIMYLPQIGDIKMSNDPYIKLVRATNQLAQEMEHFGKSDIYNYQGPADYYPDHRYIVLTDPQSNIDQLEQNIVVFDPELKRLKLLKDTDYVVDNETYQVYVDYHYPNLMNGHYAMTFPYIFSKNPDNNSEHLVENSILCLGLSENKMLVDGEMQRVSLYTNFRFKISEKEDEKGETTISRTFFPDIYALSKDMKKVFRVDAGAKYTIIDGEVDQSSLKPFTQDEEEFRAEINSISSSLIRAGIELNLQSPDDKHFISSKIVERNGKLAVLAQGEEAKPGEYFVPVYKMKHQLELERLQREYLSPPDIPYGSNYNPLEN